MPRRLDRRDVLLLSAVAPAIWATRALAQAAPAYPVTIENLRLGTKNEMAAHFRYVAFSKKADAEGYKGIAYMFTALATSELIHAQNYDRILVLLGAAIDHPQAPTAPVSDTKSNLISAAEAEINTIDKVYPAMLEKLRTENHGAAIESVEYAWKSHRQHRDIIVEIQEWSPSFFETVAQRIDGETDHYYVCRICGSTLNETPPEKCPICAYPSAHYSYIDQRTFL
ncbi:MAG: ferritin family protein [Kiloniellales bacterium]|nr:ferritin family protein [Kiloniellales bacterium]